MKWLNLCLIILAFGVSELAESEEVSAPQLQQCIAVVGVNQNGDLRELSESELEIIADEVSMNEEFLELKGNVILRDHIRTINSERMLYDQKNNLIHTDDDASVYESGYRLSGDGFVIDRAREVITSGNVEFELYSVDAASEDSHTITARGEADSLHFEEGIWMLKGVSATHCPEGVDDVYIRAADIEIDTTARQGRAKGAVLMILGKPVIYSPFIGFPLGTERLSGFLFPVIGYQSKQGAIIKVPYYFNLAPNYDATLSTNILSKRGLQLEGEFRHLGVHSDTKLRSEFLHRDKRYQGKENRYAAHLESKWFNGSNLYSNVNSKWVSDRAFTRDFSSLFGGDDQYLKRSVEAGAFGDRFKVSFGADRYVIATPTVDESNRTHDRVPWATYDHSVPFGKLFNLELGLYVDRFHHKSKPSATRYRTDTAIEYLLDQKFGSLGFRAGGEKIEYRKKSNFPEGERSRDTISSKYFEADGRLFFDRTVQTDGDERVWTIEPRIKFVSAPRNEQVEIPVFDTTIRTIDNYDDLFESKQYVGGDRVRDLEQLSAGISFSMDGRPGYQNIRKFGIGRIFYSSDRTQTLTASDDSAKAGKDKSDIFLGANIIEPQWQFDYGMLYDDDTKKVNQTSLRYTQKIRNDIKLSTIYRFTRDDDEQVGALIDVPMKIGWRSRFLLVESVRDHKLKKAEWQLDYFSCCLNVGLRMTRELVNNVGLDNSVKLLVRIENFGIN